MDFDYQRLIDETSALYIFIGKETCPTTGKLHHQGFIYFEGQRSSIKGVAKDLGKCHVKPCKGNLDQNLDYCGKDEDIKEFGVRPKQGFRTDLDAVKSDILSHKISVDELCVNNPILFHQYGRTLNKLEDIALRKRYRMWQTKCEWVYGPTGTGKSHYAFKDFNPELCYVYPNDGGWWDGYTGQEIVIINEFRGGIMYNELLELLDKYPKTVRRRGREPVPFLAKKVIITSSLHPKRTYEGVLEKDDNINQLLRRCDIIHLTQKWSEGNTGPLT